MSEEEGTKTEGEDQSGTPEPTAKREGTNGEQLPTWKYAEGVSGSGNVPDWFLADKYRTVEEQAKAANELRRKLGSKAEDAPDAYSLDYEKYGIDKEDAILAEFNPFFKEMNLPQKDYEKVIDKFVQIQNAQHERLEKEKQEAFSAFGADTKETVGRLNHWINNNFSTSEQSTIKNFMGSADEIRVLEKMRQGAPKSSPPTSHQIPSQNVHETQESINNEIRQNWMKMKDDPEYRSMMLNKRNEAHKREGG